MTWEALDLIFFGFVLGMVITLWVVWRPEKPPPERPSEQPSGKLD